MARAPSFTSDQPVIVIGGGPAGLTAAYELATRGQAVTVCEADQDVGGLARTLKYKGFRFDIGGHRFFTKSFLIDRMWRLVLGDDFLRRSRLSRIYYRGTFFDYPLKAANVLGGLGLATSARVLASYVVAKMRPIRPETSFADWVTNRFGRRLYQTFFATYTEKVWGMPPEKIGAQWAAQRIKGLSMRSAIQHMIWPPRESDSPGRIRTLINEFDYPRLGPGMMWDRMAGLTTAAGGRIRTETSVVGLHHDGTRMRAVEVESGGVREMLPAGHVISTMPIRDLIGAISPAPPAPVVDAANRLKYRDFLTVALVIDVPSLFPDNWIYVHDETVKVGRIQNFKNWSPDMVPDASQTCLGLEYFCFENDGLWSLSDADLIALGTREIAHLGLADPARVVDGAVVRVRKAYPVYDDGFVEALAVVRDYVSGFENLQLVGRNGMHKYNNQDHSMLTAILAVRNLFGASYDVWALNSDDDYQEDGAGDSGLSPDHELDLRDVRLTQPHVPMPLSLERDR